ncbi:MAG: hypothetical protein FJY97_20635 [candidate division Zixibacteria bacterium]|nr:hypothetical protein [candidate division Zixibacteria bacterium]
MALITGLEDVLTVNAALLQRFEGDLRDSLPFMDLFLRKVRAIRDDGLCRINDRRMIKMIKLMLAHALIEGRAPVYEDMFLLDYTWDDPENLEQRELLHEIAYR